MEDDPSKKFFPANAPEPNFSKVSAFTGEDERFAYKRAVSRLKEMTGSKRWVEEAHWKPLETDARPWESFEEGVPLSDEYYLGGNTKNSSNTTSEPSRSTGLAQHLVEDESKYTSPFRKLRDALQSLMPSIFGRWSSGDPELKSRTRMLASGSRVIMDIPKKRKIKYIIIIIIMYIN